MFLVRAPYGTTFGGRFETSPLTLLIGLFLGACAALAVLVAKPYLERAGEEKGEFYALLLWGHLGVSLMTRGLDLLIVFIGLETLSLAFYVLAAFFRTRRSLLGGRPEVFPDGRVRLGVHALRRRAPLRRRRELADRGPGAAGPGREPRRRVRAAAPPRRVRLQDVARALPRLGAGRLPGHADARGRLSLRGAEGRERPRALPGLRRGLRERACPTSSAPRSPPWRSSP